MLKTTKQFMEKNMLNMKTELLNEKKEQAILRWLGIKSTQELVNLIQELEKLFQKFPDGFLKHCEVRPDQEKLDGESWTVILDCSRYKFKKNFKIIGKYYESEIEYIQAKDKFEGMPYCSVLTKNHRRTAYYRNHELLENLLENSINNSEQELSIKK